MSLLESLNPASLYLKIAKILGAILLVIAILTGVYYAGYQKGMATCQISVMDSTITKLEDHAKELANQQANFNESVESLNKTLADHTQTTKIINTNVEKEVEKIVYRNILVPSSGMFVLADNASTLNSKRISRSPIGEVSRNPDTN